MAPKSPKPRTVEEIFKDYRARRTALIHALTRDADQVYDLCDPDKRECFCLYGLSDKTWEVTAPEELVPTELPEPVLGINFGKEGMDRTKWLYLVAIHSDSWLLAVAFYNGFSLDCDQRKHLFNLMNDLPTVAEVVADHWKLDDEDKSTEDSRTNTREITDIEDEEDEDEEDEDEGDEDEGDGEEEVEDEVSCVVQVENNPKFADEDDQNATYPLRKLSIMQPEDEDKHNENEILCEGWGANYDGGL